MPLYSIDKLPTKSISRFSSGNDEIDWLLGSQMDGWGFVRGSISLWGGSQGVGKTRLLSGIAKRIVNNGLTCIFHQIEQPLKAFKQKYLSDYTSGRYLLSNSHNILDQLIEMRTIKPDIVIIDSINKLAEFRNSDAALKDLEAKYREVATDINCHILLITQLNNEGNIKGGTSLPHMVDTVVHVEHAGKPDFSISIDTKNRYGSVPKEIMCRHLSEGVAIRSQNRLDDDEWPEKFKPKTKDNPVINPPARPRSLIRRILDNF